MSEQVSRPFFAINGQSAAENDEGIEDPFASVAYDREAKRHINIRSKEIKETYDKEGNKHEEYRLYPLAPCTMSNFYGDFEQLFYE